MLNSAFVTFQSAIKIIYVLYFFFQSKHSAPNATMDKVVYAKKKGRKTFGVPLAELVQLAPQGYKVPFIVKKICTYIEHHGMKTLFLV